MRNIKVANENTDKYTKNIFCGRPTLVSDKHSITYFVDHLVVFMVFCLCV